MSKQTRVRLFLLLVLFGTLTGVLAPPAGQVAVAAPPCESCDPIYDNCMAGLCCSTCNQSDTCCQARADNCWRWCI
jgi:hypothetical protein